jgi:hypothetical protein
MTASSFNDQNMLHDPAWLPHRYDPQHDAFHFIRADRAERAGATFLTDEYLPGRSPVVVARDPMMQAAPASAPIHFLFHSAYCCSTLLARALDLPGQASTLKEPVLLNDLVGWRHRGGEGRRIAMILDQGLRLLARPFAPGEAVILKPSNVVNALIPAMMAMRPDARILFLHAPLEQYLSSIARKGMWTRLWVRELMVKQMRDGLIQLGLDEPAYLQLTDLQAAAVGWLAQQAQFANLLRSSGPDRARSLDSERLMADPLGHLAALAAHYGLTLDGPAIDAVLEGPAFATDSKTGTRFGAGQRQADRAGALAVHGEEIAMVLRWAQEVAARFSIPMTLPQPLLA